VGVLAVGLGVMLWRLAPQLIPSGAQPLRSGVASTRWSNLVRWSYWISTRAEALAIIGLGIALVAATLGGA
jgi:hypothetical protein